MLFSNPLPQKQKKEIGRQKRIRNVGSAPDDTTRAKRYIITGFN